jgi:hypothetical protein
MTGFDSKRQAALDKLFEVENKLGLHYDQRTPMTKDEALKLALVIDEFDGNDESLPLELLKPIAETLRALAQPDHIVDANKMAQQQEPRNFCPRCGKRTADLTVIHTCTLPQEKNT